MTTPTYKRLTDELQPVRYYTDKDPYYYTIDNRPLQDLDYNIGQLLSVADSSRRAALINSLSEAAQGAGLFGLTGVRTLGLEAYELSEGVAALTPGVLFEDLALSSTDSSVVLKKASYPRSLPLSVPTPNLIDHELYYLIQVRYVDGGTGTPGLYEDSTNEFLPSTLLNGKLEVGTVQGVEAPLGTAALPVATEGWYPLYSVKRVYDDVAMTISRHVSAPSFAKIPESRLQMEKPFDIGFFVSGVQPANTLAFKLAFARTVYFDDLSESILHSTVAATSSAVYSIRKNGIEVGTITVGIGGTSRAFAPVGVSEVTFNSGDILEVVTPEVADATLAGVSITLVGRRP